MRVIPPHTRRRAGVFGRLHACARSTEGFSLIIVLAVMLVGGLLTVAAFTASAGDIQLSHRTTAHSQAYYAALSGVEEYDYKLQDNPDYWENCEGPSGESEGAHYEVKVLPASSAPTGTTACSTSNPFATAIESKGSVANTFRVQSTACYAPSEKLTTCAEPTAPAKYPAKEQVRSTIATFQVTGFLDFAYFTQYEDMDYNLSGNSQAECEQYYAARKGKSCIEIEFKEEDSVAGPMHTDDAARMCGKVEFGRTAKELEEAGSGAQDTVEINGGPVACGSGATPVYNTASGSYTKGKELQPPQSDSTLKAYVNTSDLFEGITHLVLNGSSNTIEVTNGGTTKTISWPENGLIYITKSKGACIFEYKQIKVDTSTEWTEEEGCGTVFVSGTYSKSLTIAAERDLIINGNIIPTGISAGERPTGTDTLGLIASNYVRIYHPVGTGTDEYNSSTKAWNCTAANATGSLKEPWVYAAILSTTHSFVVDNFPCGSGTELGSLNIYGAIAQKFRGVVIYGSGSTRHGYVKNYIYDQRLATEEPPYFLAPLKAGWQIVRETSSQAG